MTRREWLAGVAAAAMARTTLMATGRAARDAVDHLLLGAADLERGIDWLEARTGVRAALGGSHPGVGTRNALASLGDRHYLEIIAPDPAQSVFNFQIDLRRLASPRLVSWAASTVDPEEVAAAARRAGLGVSGPRDGSRLRPDGTTLRWRTVGVDATLGDDMVDPVPFFIAWAADVRHPSQDAPAGCRLTALEIAAPDPGRLKAVLSTLGVDAVVGTSTRPTLRATLDTPKGRITIE